MNKSPGRVLAILSLFVALAALVATMGGFGPQGKMIDLETAWKGIAIKWTEAVQVTVFWKDKLRSVDAILPSLALWCFAGGIGLLAAVNRQTQSDTLEKVLVAFVVVDVIYGWFFFEALAWLLAISFIGQIAAASISYWTNNPTPGDLSDEP
ncbi:hypothetical protein [Acrocarpospora sp. B8E8]|uniref:hypothetical protein n=1 Tax=Acrocarpospora sp. B8E8 TaxID=3153572 RepID=UPI00325C810E